MNNGDFGQRQNDKELNVTAYVFAVVVMLAVLAVEMFIGILPK